MKYKGTIDVIDAAQCTGCSACYNACPKDSISMEYDSEGFLSPVVDGATCIKCGKCLAVCPVAHPKNGNDASPDCYMARVSDDYLYESTSGGAFWVLSKYILDRNGVIVGAGYGDDFTVIHQIAENEQQVKKLKKTKYVQSEIGLVFRAIKEILDVGRHALFVGTPCQVAGLQNYLHKKYSNLYTVDLICHGVPAPQSWKKYLLENFDISELDDIEFRYKNRRGGRPTRFRFIYKDGHQVIEKYRINSYGKHFRKDIGLRRSCYDCDGAVFPRVGDFSIGDFWGADQYFPELVERAKGLSVVICNNDHARELVPFLEKNFDLFQPITPKQALARNRRFQERAIPNARSKFFSAMNAGESFESAVDVCEYDVAIYGATMGSNYGGLLTYYALYRACENMGLSTIMIRPFLRSNPVSEPESEKSHGTRFSEENITLSDQKYLKDFDQYNSLADTFILGSDQVWNIECFSGRGMSFYLDFVDSSKKKIAFAASFGASKPTFLENYEYLYPQIYHWINQIDYAAVREADGVGICNEYFDMEATHVLDPVFLIPASEYLELSERAARKPKGNYMAVYELTPSKRLTSVIQYVSKKKKLKRVNMGPGNPAKWERKQVKADMPWLPNVQVEEWLYNLAHSQFVVTDSFHGMCFAIIFRKPFIVILPRHGRIQRVLSLLEKLDLMDRWYGTYKEFAANIDIVQKPIDYDKVHSILEQEIEASKWWLLNAIKNKKTVYNHSVEDIAGFANCQHISCEEARLCIDRVIEEGDRSIIVASSSSKHGIVEHALNACGLSVDDESQDEAIAIMWDPARKDPELSHGELARIRRRQGVTEYIAAVQKCSLSEEPTFNEFVCCTVGAKNVYSVPWHAYVAVFSATDGRIVDFLTVETTNNALDANDQE